MSAADICPYLESVRPAPEIRTPGRCRVCGCTDDVACIIGGGIPELGYTETCAWVEADLCSRCHGPSRPTRAQEGELARIRDRKGALRIRRGPQAGELVVTLAAHASWDMTDHPTRAGQTTRVDIPAPVLRLDRRGHLVTRRRIPTLA